MRVLPNRFAIVCAAGGLLTIAACSGRPSAPAFGTLRDTSGVVWISPGESIQAKVDAAPAGTHFVLKAGTHLGQRVVPKDDMWFVGEPGAIMDGEGTTPYAFETLTSHAANVHIQGLVITRYSPPYQRAAIQGDNGTGWVIDSDEVSFSAYEGVHPGTGGQILHCHIHDNRVGGIGAYQSDGVLIDGNEIDSNGLAMTTEDPATAEAAGMKIMKQQNLIVRNNYIHDNMRGLWIDTGYEGTLIENNIVTGNEKAGIWIEATYGALIRGNRAEMNGGTTTGGWLGHAGIQITNSPNVEVSGNTVANNMNGIGVMETSGYPDGPYGPLHVQNLYVHGNTISMAGGNTGLDENVGDSSVFTRWNNRFVQNTYTLGAGAGFAWLNQLGLTPKQWQGYGQDVNGTFSP